MKEKKKESTVILIIAVSLVCVCIAAVIGIGAIIRNSKPAEAEAIDTLAPAPEPVADIKVEEIVPDEQVTVNIDFSAGDQQIQEEAKAPEVPDNPEPVGDITDPTAPPEYDLPELQDQPTEPQITPDQPAPGGEPGQVYVPGFGWVTPTGGHSIPAPDLVPNGNIIGSM